jgi:hypothetical protein
MNYKIIVLLGAFFLASCATSSKKEYNQEPKTPPGTGAYFSEVCESPRSELCVAFVSGFLTGQEGTIESVKLMDNYQNSECRVQGKEKCNIDNHKLLSVLKYGCKDQMNSLDWDSIIELMKNQIIREPALLKASFSLIYGKSVMQKYSSNCQ